MGPTGRFKIVYIYTCIHLCIYIYLKHTMKTNFVKLLKGYHSSAQLRMEHASAVLPRTRFIFYFVIFFILIFVQSVFQLLSCSLRCLFAISLSFIHFSNLKVNTFTMFFYFAPSQFIWLHHPVWRYVIQSPLECVNLHRSPSLQNPSSWKLHILEVLIIFSNFF